MQSLCQLLDEEYLGGKRKLQAVTAYLTPELKQVLEEWAEDESRSLSRHIVHLLSQAAKEYQQAGEQKVASEEKNQA